MIKIIYTKEYANQNRYNRLDEYDVTKLNLKQGTITLDYSGVRSKDAPAKIEISFKDADSFKPGRGEFAGQTLLSGGQVTTVKFFDDDGNLIIKMTGLTMDAGMMYGHLLKYAGSLFGHMVADGYQSIIEQNDLFIEIQTGSGNDLIEINSTKGSYIPDDGGSDNYIGDPDGYDILAYDGYFWNSRPGGTGIVVDFKNGTVTGLGDDIDTFKNIDQVRGTQFDDKFIGNKKDNTFQGAGGNDIINGGKGFDIAAYDVDDNQFGYEGIVAKMAKNTVRDGYRTVDKLKNIEGISGTSYDDLFIGGKKDDWFRGREGADTFQFNGKDFGKNYLRDFSSDDGDVVALTNVKKFAKLNVEIQGDGTLVTLNDDSSIFFRDYFDVTKSDFDFG